MSGMERSFAARFAVRPVTRFVRPATGVGRRRMGLRSFTSFTPAPVATTVLRRTDLGAGPIVRLRAEGRGALPAVPRARAGAPRPAVAIHWAHSARGHTDRRSSAAAAPWRG